MRVRTARRRRPGPLPLLQHLHARHTAPTAAAAPAAAAAAAVSARAAAAAAVSAAACCHDEGDVPQRLLADGDACGGQVLVEGLIAQVVRCKRHKPAAKADMNTTRRNLEMATM